MLALLKIELKKMLKMQQIYLSIIGAVLFSLIIFINYIGEKGVSAFTIPIAALGNLTQTFIIVVFLGFGAYIYGVEIQEKTLKILYSKTIPEWKIILAKFFVGIIYTFILMFIVCGVVLLISIIFYPQLDFLEFGGEELISAEEGFKYVFLAYFLQGLSLIFVVCLSITISIIFNSAVLSIIMTFFIMIFSFIAGNVDFIRPLLPTTYWLVWQDVMKKNILWDKVALSISVLIFYSVILYVIAVYFYKKKEVSI